MSLQVEITKRLGNFTLDIAFSATDEILAILGASGCGKSMTLKCIAGIEKPDKGRIVLNNRVLFDSSAHINLSPQQRQAGYLFQNYALFPNLTVYANIGVGIKSPAAVKQQLIAEKIKEFYLEGQENKFPHQLSGGQQQRVALARMLAQQPQLIMLDEPFSALDNHLQWQTEQQIRQILDRFSGTVLFVSHNRDEVYRLCDRAAVLDQGHIDFISDKHSFFDSPRTAASAQLTGCQNISSATKIDAHTVMANDWQLSLTTKAIVPDDIAYIGYRSHYLYPATSVGGNVYPLKIKRIIEDSFSMIILMANPNNSSDNAPTIRWKVDKNNWQDDYHEQQIVYIGFNPEKVLLLSK